MASRAVASKPLLDNVIRIYDIKTPARPWLLTAPNPQPPLQSAKVDYARVNRARKSNTVSMKCKTFYNKRLPHPR